MFFRLQHPPFAFEIPDDWLVEAGVAGFIPDGPSYLYTAETENIIPLEKIAPILRNPNTTRDFWGFRRKGGIEGNTGGMIDVLQAIINGIHLPPVMIRCVKGTSADGFTHVVNDGFHRFYASHALGFTHIPSTIGPDWCDKTKFGDEI